MNPEECSYFAQAFSAISGNIGQAVLGKAREVSLVLTAMLAGGHVLLEDAPGTGKTSLAKTLAASIEGTHNRIQFTPDLLPSDVIGVTIYDQTINKFEFHPGPVFSNVLLADEINRASPKTQSALLEVMEEGQVTVDGRTHPVPSPFMVIATQNPIEQVGTYRLPEAQLDRFLIKTSIGYPDHDSAMAILADASVKDRSARIAAVINSETLLGMMQISQKTHVDSAVADYVLRICEATRTDNQTSLGVSVRGGLALIRCAKVWAPANNRSYVTPDDIKALAVPVLAHRLIVDPEAEFSGTTASSIVARILAETHPPAERVAQGV